MPVGSDLKAARKKAGISLDVIAKRTKIQIGKLVALEHTDFKNLPAGFYLFSMVRAYAHEVHIDPEPIVAGLRTEFAEKDAMEALHALAAAGALSAKKAARATSSWNGQSNVFRNVAVAAGIVVLTGVGAGAGTYLYRVRAAVPELRSTSIVRLSSLPTLNLPETPSTPAPAVEAPPQPAGDVQKPSAKIAKTKSRRTGRRQASEETVDIGNGASEASSPAPSEEHADHPASAPEVAPAP